MEEVQRVKWCVSREAGFILDEVRLRGVERRMIRMMCGVILVDRVLTDVLLDRVGVVVKIEDMIIQGRLRWYGHVMRGDMISQIREVMEVELGKGRRVDQGNCLCFYLK